MFINYHPQPWLNVHQVITGGLFIAEDVGVKVVDCICCDESADQSDGPGNQNSHIVGAGHGRVPVRVPVWGPVVPFL